MGLSKQIELDNGIVVGYHRIVSVNVVTNTQNTIEVASYIDSSKRRKEVEDLVAMRKLQPGDNFSPTPVFIHTTFLDADYDPDMNIGAAYDWVKGQELFEGAEDEDESYYEEAEEEEPEPEPEPESEPSEDPEEEPSE